VIDGPDDLFLGDEALKRRVPPVAMNVRPLPRLGEVIHLSDGRRFAALKALQDPDTVVMLAAEADVLVASVVVFPAENLVLEDDGRWTLDVAEGRKIILLGG